MCVLSGMILAAPIAAARPEQPADGAKTILAVETAGLGRLLVDPKDQGLARAMSMTQARVSELPMQFDGMPPEAVESVSLVLDLLARPMRFGAIYNENNPTGLFGYGLMMSFRTADENDAKRLSGRIDAILAKAPEFPPTQPNSTWAGMRDLQLPMGRLSFGARQGKGGWSYGAFVGSVDDPDAPFAGLAKAADGMEPVVLGRFDLSGLTPAADMAIGMAGNNPELSAMIENLKQAGVLGPDAMHGTFAMGYTKDESLSVATISGMARVNQLLGGSTEPLTPADLAVIPADATMAGIQKGDLSFLNTMLDEASKRGAPVDEMMAQFQEQTGVDLRHDIIDTLGGTFAYYMADSTGGGGLLSSVMLVTVKDRARFKGAHDKLATMANALADELPLGPGHIRLASWKEGSTDLVTLRFPGLPVPLELTYALSDRWLIMGFTPQATLAAVRQANGKGDAGLASNPAVASKLPKGRALASLQYLDTPRYMRDGYTTISLAGSAIANAMRSPTDPGREPGMVVPLYHELAKGAKPTVEVSYWNGEDLVYEAHADRSMLVNAAGAVGSLQKFMPLIAGGMAAMAMARQGRMGGMGMDDLEPADVRVAGLEARDWPEILLHSGMPMPIAHRVMLASAAATSYPSR